MIAKRKVVIIGAGAVGGTAACTLMVKTLKKSADVLKKIFKEVT